MLCCYWGRLCERFNEGSVAWNSRIECCNAIFGGGVQNTEGWQIAALSVGCAIVCLTLFKILELKELGGCGVAEKLGGTRIDRSATAWDEKRFYNVVEETALACGVPAPVWSDGDSALKGAVAAS